MNYKLMTVIITAIFLSGAVSAQQSQFSFPQEEVEYGDETSLVIEINDYECPTGADCNPVTVEICGSQTDFEKHTSPTGDREVYQLRSGSNSNPSGEKAVGVPMHFACGLGEHTINLKPGTGNTYSGGSLTVNAGSSSRNYAPYLHVKMDTGVNPPLMTAMFLTNQEWPDGPSFTGESGLMFIQERDASLGSGGDEKAVYRADGGIITDNLASVIDCTELELDQGDRGDGVCKVNNGNAADGTCSDDPCSIVTRSFTTDGNQYIYESETWYPDDISPLHANRAFIPQGEVAVGVNEDPNVDKRGFWVCRDGSDGVSVDTIPDNFGDGVFRCYVDGSNWDDEVKPWVEGEMDKPNPYTWVGVETCGDGVNNNPSAGSNTDLDDQVCDGSFNQEESKTDCTVPVIARDQDGSKSAFYRPVSAFGDFTDPGENPYTPSQESSYSGCKYNEKQDNVDYDAETQEPVEFECTDSGSEYTGYNGPSELESEAESFCTGLGNMPYSTHDGSMPAVMYFVKQEALPTGPGKYVNNDGFKNYHEETIHQVENNYVGVNNPHTKSVWDSKDMINTGAYSSDPVQNTDAWTVSNAGVNNEKVYYSETAGGTVGEKEVFSGGFAGNCQSPDKWVYSGDEWRCDVITDDVEIIVNTYNLNSDLPERFAGFQINESEMEKWQIATNTPPVGNTGTGNVQVRAQCWHGGTGSSDISAMGDRVNLSAEVSDLSSPVFVVGEIPERSDGGPSEFTSDQYSCIFGFRQRVDSRSSAGISDSVRLFQDGEGGSADSPKSSGWITEGTKENGRVQVRVERINVPSGDTASQTWLQNRASNTAGQLWPNFRVAPPQIPCETRNPVKFLDIKGEC